VVKEAEIPAELQEEAEVILAVGPYQVAKGITTTGEVPRRNDFEKLTGRLADVVTFRNGQEVKDTIQDDLSIVLQLANGSVIVLAGCCHSGISNTISHVAELTKSKSIIGILGGLHLRDASKDRLEKTVNFLSDFPLTTVAPCHCTGLRGRAALLYAFDEKFKEVGAGDVVKFTST